MRPMRTLLLGLMGSVLLLGCGFKIGYRHFAGPTLPTAEQEQELRVGDDRSITFLLDRLEVSLRPMTDEMLNRQFTAHSTTREGFYQNPSVSLTNPYTYGDWKPLGQESAPDRFAVFQLKVKNYAFPKVRVDPSKIYIAAPNGQRIAVVRLDDKPNTFHIRSSSRSAANVPLGLGKWYKIRCLLDDTGKLSAWLNGSVRLETTVHAQPPFVIGLQCERSGARFRNIVLREACRETRFGKATPKN